MGCEALLRVRFVIHESQVCTLKVMNSFLQAEIISSMMSATDRLEVVAAPKACIVVARSSDLWILSASSGAVLVLFGGLT